MSIKNKKETFNINKIGKTEYLGDRISKKGQGSTKKRGPYSGGRDPYEQLGGAQTKRKNTSANVAALEELVEGVNPGTPDSGVSVELQRVVRQMRKRKRKESDLSSFNADLDTIIMPPKRRAPTQTIGNDVKTFLAKIRPVSTKKIQEPTGPYSLNAMLKRAGAIRKGNKKTKTHTVTQGWIMHGKDGGAPRTGRRAAKIRAYVERALKAYKKPSSRASSSWIAAAKTQRGRGLVGHALAKGAASLAGSLGKNVLKQVFMRNSIPTYRLLANKGEDRLRGYLQKKNKREKGFGYLQRLKS